MPLIAAPVIAPPDTGEPPAGGGGGGGIILPDLGRAAVTYYDPVGGVWPLTTPSLGWKTLAEGVSGLGATAYELTTDPRARGGVTLRHAQAQARQIVWPLQVRGDSHMGFVTRWRQLASAFTRTLRDGPGVLEIARPDGSRRQISVLYQEGWEGRGAAGSGWIVDTAVMTLLCEDPYWVDPVPVVVHREQAAGSSFFTPYPTVSSSQVLGATTVTVPGDVTVWPTWTITGPASLITFTHQGTGEAFTLNPSAVGHGALLAGETVTVRTDPPRVRYQDGSPDGSNWIGALNWPSAALWGLAPGDNPVTFQLSGSGPGSAVDLSFYPRYETA
ncbi:phage tail protein [Streptomyces sp. SID161]|uniref:phage tail protein n=1 Tax=Streptomyces sp. SID161 TaxID=2690251 RepID=UPI001370E14F|nr:phage tail protein [Streptomyces sp. SID161]MYW48888.1 phage tail protein [Streptomyces sp. SID161]MYW49827.1 phage tail protein [Streptomyces sp. SID161]